MNHVFISYAREDAAAAARIGAAFAASGLLVGWDQKIPPGRTWDEVIGAELDTAGCVVVLWSRHSVQSRFVREEAERGAARGCLIPVLIESIEPPFGFALIQAADLSKWKGDAREAGFVELLTAIRERVHAAPTPAAGAAPGPGAPESQQRKVLRRPAFYVASAVAVAVGLAAGWWGMQYEPDPSLEPGVLTPAVGPDTPAPAPPSPTPEQAAVRDSTQVHSLAGAFRRYRYDFAWAVDTVSTKYVRSAVEAHFDGDTILFTFTEPRLGQLRGTVSGRTFAGRWRDVEGTGDFELHFDEAFEHAAGWWSYGPGTQRYGASMDRVGRPERGLY